MPWHFTPVAETGRFYVEAGGYDRKEPYPLVVTLVWQGPYHVFLEGMHGRLTRQAREEIEAALAARGVTRVTMVRHGREKALVWDGDRFVEEK